MERKIERQFGVNQLISPLITVNTLVLLRYCLRLTSIQWSLISNLLHFRDPYIPGGQPMDDRIYIESRIERAPDYTEDRIEEWRVSEMIISSVMRSDDGLYECQATNEGGKFFKSGHIQGSCQYAKKQIDTQFLRISQLTYKYRLNSLQPLRSNQ